MQGVINSSDSFQKKMVEIICLAIGVVSSVATIQDGLTAIDRIFFADLILMSIGFAGYFWSKYNATIYKVLTVPLLVLLYAEVLFQWFELDGSLGGPGIALIGVIIIGLILLKRIYQTPFLIFNILLISSLTYLQIYHPELIRGSGTFSLGKKTDYLIYASSIIVFVYLLVREYDKEKKTTLSQNDQLQKLNQSLQASILEKEEIIQDLDTTKDHLMEAENLASIGNLAAGIAHELNNPLNYIGGAVNPVKRDLEELKKYINTAHSAEVEELYTELFDLLEHVEHGTTRATSIVANLTKRFPKQKEADIGSMIRFNVSELTKTVIRHFEKSYPAVRINQILENDIPVKGVKMEIDHVLSNILQNAIQAIPKHVKGVVDVHAFTKDKSVVVTISDNGIGIDKEDLNQIFEPFFTSQEKSGAGLGLFSANSMVKKHSGHIKVESDPGIGTTISVFLPLAL
ncbi:MAG: GHKL domain-containing protein [Cyclobacteriaceae bacterium]